MRARIPSLPLPVVNDAGVSEEEVEQYLEKYDPNGDGKITLVEFLQASGHKLKA